MSLLFQITLSAPQIDLLRRFVEFSEGTYTEWVGSEFSHFIVHVKPLLRESLIYHKPPKDKSGKHEWGVTEKGRLLLQVIDIELRETAKSKTIGQRRQRASLPISDREAKENSAMKGAA